MNRQFAPNLSPRIWPQPKNLNMHEICFQKKDLPKLKKQSRGIINLLKCWKWPLPLSPHHYQAKKRTSVRFSGEMSIKKRKVPALWSRFPSGIPGNPFTLLPEKLFRHSRSDVTLPEDPPETLLASTSKTIPIITPKLAAGIPENTLQELVEARCGNPCKHTTRENQEHVQEKLGTAGNHKNTLWVQSKTCVYFPDTLQVPAKYAAARS